VEAEYSASATLPAGPQLLPASQKSTWPAVAPTALSAVSPYWSGRPVYIWHAVVSQITPEDASNANA
jgi:hypothetical protein